MRIFVLVPQYFVWHYTQALRNIIHSTKNLIWFFWHFFSIGLLTKTLFLPWQKIQDERPRGLDISGILSTLLINVLMRIAGAVIRLIMICIGLIAIFSTLIGGIVVFVLWLVYPFLILFVLFVGIVILVKR